MTQVFFFFPHKGSIRTDGEIGIRSAHLRTVLHPCYLPNFDHRTVVTEVNALGFHQYILKYLRVKGHLAYNFVSMLEKKNFIERELGGEGEGKGGKEM